VVLLEGDQAGEAVGPSSYLDVYKTTFKIHSSMKERMRVANELKASTNGIGSTKALDKRVF